MSGPHSLFQISLAASVDNFEKQPEKFSLLPYELKEKIAEKVNILRLFQFWLEHDSDVDIQEVILEKLKRQRDDTLFYELFSYLDNLPHTNTVMQNLEVMFCDHKISQPLRILVVGAQLLYLQHHDIENRNEKFNLKLSQLSALSHVENEHNYFCGSVYSRQVQPILSWLLRNKSERDKFRLSINRDIFNAIVLMACIGNAFFDEGSFGMKGGRSNELYQDMKSLFSYLDDDLRKQVVDQLFSALDKSTQAEAANLDEYIEEVTEDYTTSCQAVIWAAACGLFPQLSMSERDSLLSIFQRIIQQGYTAIARVEEPIEIVAFFDLLKKLMLDSNEIQQMKIKQSLMSLLHFMEDKDSNQDSSLHKIKSATINLLSVFPDLLDDSDKEIIFSGLEELLVSQLTEDFQRLNLSSFVNLFPMLTQSQRQDTIEKLFHAMSDDETHVFNIISAVSSLLNDQEKLLWKSALLDFFSRVHISLPEYRDEDDDKHDQVYISALRLHAKVIDAFDQVELDNLVDLLLQMMVVARDGLHLHKVGLLSVCEELINALDLADLNIKVQLDSRQLLRLIDVIFSWREHNIPVQQAERVLSLLLKHLDGENQEEARKYFVDFQQCYSKPYDRLGELVPLCALLPGADQVVMTVLTDEKKVEELISEGKEKCILAWLPHLNSQQLEEVYVHLKELIKGHRLIPYCNAAECLAMHEDSKPKNIYLECEDSKGCPLDEETEILQSLFTKVREATLSPERIRQLGMK